MLRGCSACWLRAEKDEGPGAVPGPLCFASLRPVRVGAQLSGFAFRCSAWGAVASGEADATGPWDGFASDSLSVACRLLSSALRLTLCRSAHCWQRVCPSIAGSWQCRQRPKDLAPSNLFLKLVLGGQRGWPRFGLFRLPLFPGIACSRRRPLPLILLGRLRGLAEGYPRGGPEGRQFFRGFSG